MTELPLNQILCGPCEELLQDFPENSIDLVATDPPYGLSFMGKEWDKALPSKAAFKQVIRVLKPGALAFVMSSPRQDLMWRMCALLEGVGFEMRQSFLSWIYKTGFPKAYDVSKGIDKKLGLERRIIGYTNPSDPLHSGRGGGSGFDTTHDKIPITEPVSDEAKEWDGWKSQTGLKPALEPILMVNKPFSESTIVDNVLRWGTGAINVDATRIPFQNENDKEGSKVGYDYFGARNSLELSKHEDYPKEKYNEKKGRFPANLLVSDGALDTGEITKSGAILPHHKRGDENGYLYNYGIYGKFKSRSTETVADEGSPYRFFDLDAWAQHHGFLDVPKPDTKERDYGLQGVKKEPKSKFNKGDGKNERFDGAVSIPRRNTHPTVKPIKLMAYLIELGCPRNGVVLDPFLGSGTTCIAAKQLGRRYIGIEINPEDYVMAEARVAAYPQPLEWFQESQDVR